MQNTLMGNLIQDRGNGGSCGVRPPTNRYPVYSKTFRGTFDVNGQAVVDFEAQRDTFLTTLSVDTGTNDRVMVSADYCNTKYLKRSSVQNWQKCCERKPLFVVGVRDTKTLGFQLTGGAADDAFVLTVSGFQGKGCCG